MNWLFSGPQILLIPIVLLTISVYFSKKNIGFKKAADYVFIAVCIITCVFIIALMGTSIISLHEKGW